MFIVQLIFILSSMVLVSTLISRALVYKKIVKSSVIVMFFVMRERLKIRNAGLGHITDDNIGVRSQF